MFRSPKKYLPRFIFINPSKNEIRRISKPILGQINTKLVSELSVNEWKNTISDIKWLNNINGKRLYKFFQFGIKEFYPSIKKKLLHRATHN